MAEKSIKPAHNFIDLTGQKFNRLTVIKRAPDHVSESGRKRNRWLCKCDCGNTVLAVPHKLKSGHTKSCGCYHSDILAERNATHGRARTPEYKAWCKIKERCLNPNDKDRMYYSERGITICDEWAYNFEAFYEHIGPKPSADYSVDRIDNSKGYEPGNVRWASRITQCRNMRSNRMLTFNGETLCVAEWADKTGINISCLSRRINALGWSVAEALTTPVGGRRG